jgi:Zn-dependent metalloprotease
VPNLEKPEQFVYRLGAVGSSEVQSEAVQVDWLAKRHQQVEAVGQIQPDRIYISGKMQAARLKGGHLGKMQNASVAEFTAAMRRLSILSQVTGREVFRLRQVQKDASGGTHAEFEQLIDGIPIFNAGEVHFDASGNILSFGFSLAPQGIQPLKANISEQEAYSKVIAQWKYQYGATATGAEQLRSPRLYYTTDDAWASYRLEYEFRFSVDHTEYHATVDAVTGDISIFDLTKH